MKQLFWQEFTGAGEVFSGSCSRHRPLFPTWGRQNQFDLCRHVLRFIPVSAERNTSDDRTRFAKDVQQIVPLPHLRTRVLLPD